MALEIFDWVPTYGAELGVTPALLTAKFGDGYSQDTPDGINNQMEVWGLTFTKFPDVADDIINFLKRQAGAKRFWWTPPRYPEPLKWVTSGKFGKVETNAGYVTVTVTFEQRFDPDV